MVNGWNGSKMDSRRGSAVTDMDKNMVTGLNGMIMGYYPLKEVTIMVRKMAFGPIGIHQGKKKK